MGKIWRCYLVVKYDLPLHKIAEPSSLTRRSMLLCYRVTSKTSGRQIFHPPEAMFGIHDSHLCLLNMTGCSVASPLGWSPCTNPCSGFWLWYLPQNCLSFLLKLQNICAAPVTGALLLGSIQYSLWALREDIGNVQSPI